LNAGWFAGTGFIDISDDHTPRRSQVQVGNHILNNRPAPDTEAAITHLFDHLVGAGEKRRRNVKAKRLRGLNVDHQLELGWLLNGEIGGLCAFEDSRDVLGAELVPHTAEIGAVAHQPTRPGKPESP
jgi:hypothetical protein